ncbi:MAG TPA: DUF1287 domain-containing protein [Pyrinomonadaceae bacterium]|nr:DUF1287 domain-containing protein [Pyrinomonadaceae bacterium]
MNKSFRFCLLLPLLILPLAFNFACESNSQFIKRGSAPPADSAPNAPATRVVEVDSAEIKKMLESAVEQTGMTKTYDPAYVVIPYPMGDVPAETGVCTDVVIRAFRRAGTDLQKEVHEDMRANFELYPKKWGLPKPDTNIDHRRVPNLQTFFARRGKALEITSSAADYKPGDVVSWDIDGKGMTHIGLVSNIRSERTKRFLIIHNMGWGTKAEDVLFSWKITGHYRYF